MAAESHLVLNLGYAPTTVAHPFSPPPSLILPYVTPSGRNDRLMFLHTR